MNKSSLWQATIFCVLLLSLAVGASGCGDSAADSVDHKMIVIGFDGMDPELLNQYMAEGRLPNFSKLAQTGDYKTLGTSIPPQSPVAWSNFITGMNPGGHGIFDFIHRDPGSMLPVSSTSKTEGSARTVKIGKWVLPLSGGEVKNMRQGTAFWEILEADNVPTTIFRVPANFPPTESPGKSLSGMGTPDILGSFGTFSYFTDDPPPNRDDISGGVVYTVQVINNFFDAELVGPQNVFLEGEPDATIPFTVWRDPENPVVKIEIQGKKILLQEKEWSDWLQVNFDLLPLGLESVSGICRFYLKEVRPKMKLYVTPINIDPSAPAMPVSTPESYVEELHHDCGYFYTQGMPEDTKALSWDVFDHADFHSQSENVLNERLRLFDHVYSGFDKGLLFFYFSSTDLNGHMFYNMIDPNHPSHQPELAAKFGDVLASLYERADGVVGKLLDSIDSQTTLVVMSDHGFAPFRRAVHLNTWLKDEGYISLKPGADSSGGEYFSTVDWSRTQAYGLGFNGLYLNLRGREMSGFVSSRERDALLDEISQKLLALRDPENGYNVVDRVYRARDVYSGAHLAEAPDLIVGYSRGYRTSWESTIGNFPDVWIEDNLDPWSGDHCMAAELVPGVILSNRKIKKSDPKLFDLAPTILAEFGIDKRDEMVGEPIF